MAIDEQDVRRILDLTAFGLELVVTLWDETDKALADGRVSSREGFGIGRAVAALGLKGEPIFRAAIDADIDNQDVREAIFRIWQVHKGPSAPSVFGLGVARQDHAQLILDLSAFGLEMTYALWTEFDEALADGRLQAGEVFEIGATLAHLGLMGEPLIRQVVEANIDKRDVFQALYKMWQLHKSPEAPSVFGFAHAA